LVLNVRDDKRLYHNGYPSDLLFLVGYAAALLMIDSASFLRESVRDRPVLRKKLNEANREFGIPPQVYDTVQRSLVSTRTAWHLYPALMFFRDNQHRFITLGQSDASIAELLEIVGQRNHRLERPLLQIQAARLRGRARHAAHRSKNVLQRSMYGIQKMGGIALANRYLKRGHQPGMPGDVCTRICSMLQPGDVIAVRKEYAITNYFLPGYWPHVALCLGKTNDADIQVLESMKDGVFVRSISSPFASDSVVVLRPQLPPEQIAEALNRGLQHQGKGYDFSFDFSRSDRLVCTEVVYRSYDGIGPIRFPLIKRAGRMTLSGNDLVDMSLAGKFFDPVAVYAPMFDAHIQTDRPAIIDLIERCMKVETD
jgi:hypothetical protein